MLTHYKAQLEKKLANSLELFRDVPPNILTFVGASPAVLFFWAFPAHQFIWATVGLIAVCLDALDGAVARKFHKVTLLGGLLDSTLDRAADFLYLWAFVEAGVVSRYLGIAAVILSFLTSYIRSRGGLALGSDKPLAVGVIERSERLILVAIAFICAVCFPLVKVWSLSLASWCFVILTIGAAVTVFQRLQVVGRYKQTT